MAKDLIIRFLIGGTFVSLFAIIGDLFKPKSFGGLFAAAPSIALSTLILAIVEHGPTYAATEAHSMIAGAVAFCVYSQIVSWLMMHFEPPSLAVASMAIVAWLGVAFGLWAVWLI
jgi:hypothetical protein